jgi:HPt (histidine-containing phosphotransfer) domain-containing protein
MDDYISKPVRQADLISVLKQWMPMKKIAPADATESRIAVDDAAIIDSRRLHELSAIGGDDEPDLLRVLVMMFMNDSVKRIASIYTSLETGDMQKLTIAAHTLKGSSGNMGARLLVPTCAEIERLGKIQSTEGVAELYTKLETDFSLVKGALERFLKEYYSGLSQKK